MFPSTWISKWYLLPHLIVYNFSCHFLVREAATGELSQSLCWWVGRGGEREEGGGGAYGDPCSFSGRPTHHQLATCFLCLPSAPGVWRQHLSATVIYCALIFYSTICKFFVTLFQVATLIWGLQVPWQTWPASSLTHYLWQMSLLFAVAEWNEMPILLKAVCYISL